MAARVPDGSFHRIKAREKDRMLAGGVYRIRGDGNLHNYTSSMQKHPTDDRAFLLPRIRTWYYRHNFDHRNCSFSRHQARFEVRQGLCHLRDVHKSGHRFWVRNQWSSAERPGFYVDDEDYRSSKHPGGPAGSPTPESARPTG
ncbi:hypothetical protein Bbelb_086930 [Branchiostoma belcheri]|nr:hypothetical protein Bbelb_086930 [Branchiostoma belcheri]